jgi:hypothetical protein
MTTARPLAGVEALDIEGEGARLRLVLQVVLEEVGGGQVHLVAVAHRGAREDDAVEFSSDTRYAPLAHGDEISPGVVERELVLGRKNVLYSRFGTIETVPPP